MVNYNRNRYQNLFTDSNWQQHQVCDREENHMCEDNEFAQQSLSGDSKPQEEDPSKVLSGNTKFTEDCRMFEDNGGFTESARVKFDPERGIDEALDRYKEAELEFEKEYENSLIHGYLTEEYKRAWINDMRTLSLSWEELTTVIEYDLMARIPMMHIEYWVGIEKFAQEIRAYINDHDFPITNEILNHNKCAKGRER